MNKFLSVYDNVKGIYEEGNEIGFGKACLIALVAILIVFVVLCLIIGSIKLLQICVKKFSKKAPEVAKPISQNVAPVESNAPASKGEENNVNIEDDDMMAAVLVATIDYAEETKKDVKLKSVKRIG